MDTELTPEEARVIGCLLEKQITTPDQYPISLNALTAACNQKSNREPVMNLGEARVQDVVDGLIKRRLMSERSGFGSRVPKYQHRFCNTEFGSLKLSPQEVGVLCVLLLRGPQTPGELRSRAARLCELQDVQQVEGVLQGLSEREDGPMVRRLPREPGRRESRWAHLFTAHAAAEEADAAVPEADAPGRIEVLEQRIGELEEQMQALERRLAELGGE